MKKNSTKCEMYNSMQEETECQLPDTHVSLKLSFYRQVDDYSNDPDVQAEATIRFRSDDGMPNENSDIASKGGDASYLSPAAISQSFAVKDNTHHRGVYFIDDGQYCIDGVLDDYDDREVAQSDRETDPPITCDNLASSSDDSTDVLKVAVTVPEQCVEEALLNLQFSILDQEHSSEGSIAHGKKRSATKLNLSTADGDAAAKQVCHRLDGKSWAINYYKDPQNSRLVVGVRNIALAEAKEMLKNIDNRLKYSVELSPIAEHTYYVWSADPVFPIKLRSSSVIRCKEGNCCALLTGVLFKAVDGQLYGFTVGHLFESVGNHCWDENNNDIGVCSQIKVSTPEDQESNNSYVDVALIEIKRHENFRSQDVNSLPSLTQLGQPPSNTVEVNYKLCFDPPAVACIGTRIAVLVLTQDRRWKPGIIPAICETIKLPNNEGKLLTFKQCMRITCRENENAAVTDQGDSGALVILDPFKDGSLLSTPLVVVGFVIGMNSNKTFSIAISVADALETIGFPWKDCSFFDTTKSKDGNLQPDSGVCSGIG